MTQTDAIIAALVNGEERQHISIYDRGLAYGDGVFETVKIHAGKLYLWQQHKQRLFRGCRTLGISFTDEKILDEEAAMLTASIAQPAVLKVIITRGAGGRGYRRDKDMMPNRLLWVAARQSFPTQYRQQGVDVTVCRHRLASIPRFAGIKHLNRLDQVMARNEWEDEYQEGLLCDEQSNVIEGTMSNLFIIEGKKLLTPKLERCGVAGVMRAYIMEQAQKSGRPVTEQNLSVDAVMCSQGAFLCNSLIGVWPIKSLDHQPVPLPEMLPELMEWVGRV